MADEKNLKPGEQMNLFDDQPAADPAPEQVNEPGPAADVGGQEQPEGDYVQTPAGVWVPAENEEPDGDDDNDPDGCGEEECEPEDDGSGKGKGKKKAGNGKGKAEPKAPAPAPAPAKPAAPAGGKSFKYPFLIRYAAEYVDLLGFNDGQCYTTAQIKETLIQNGFTEFREMEIDLHHAEATNTLVITIRGSRKGAVGKSLLNMVSRLVGVPGPEPKRLIALMPGALLAQIEDRFRETYERHGTEDRVLVYADELGNLGVVSPDWARHRALVMGDVPLCLEVNGHLWDLAFDLHSHHLMGTFFSRTDTDNEHVRGPVFGVVSWQTGPVRWAFRRWLGPVTGFQDLTYADVVTDAGVPVYCPEALLHG